MDMLVRRTFSYLDKETFVPLYMGRNLSMRIHYGPRTRLNTLKN